MTRFTLCIVIGAVIQIALLLLSVAYGSADISLTQVSQSILRGLGLLDGETSAMDRIVFDLRLPRAVFSLLIGAGLGVVGVVLQTATRNDLADPFLFGLSSGAATGAVFVITITGDLLGFWTLPLAAFSGGMLATAIVLGLVARLRTSAPEKLILAGLAVSFLFSALTNFLVFSGDQRAAHSVIFWMLGGLGLARWSTLPLVLLGAATIIAFTLLSHRKLDALLAGDATANSLGVQVSALRRNTFIAAAFATAIFVSVSGVIGFIGLMVPHIARGLVGALHLRLAIVAAIIGGVLLTASDLLARVLLAPQELPVGVITTSLGAVFVFVLLTMEKPR
ncbi:FecCD family ABC transporter permease [Hoeflea sp.]|uniref:FecCD family ABC transporter permease n=1 Tax=Hoeflea sp. TaxID=1940281 RepID=UPI003B02E696